MSILKSLTRIGTRFLYTPTASAVVCSRCFQQQLPVWRVMPIQAFHRSFPLCPRDSTAIKETQQSQETHQENEELDKLYKMIEVEVRGYEKGTLNSYRTFVKMAAEELGITIGKCLIPKRAKHFRFSLLKSIHIYKKHQVQYEVRTYFLIMQFHRLTQSTADTFLEYIQRNLCEGLRMKVTKVSLEKLPEYLVPPVGRQSEVLLTRPLESRTEDLQNTAAESQTKDTMESSSDESVTPLSESRLDESFTPSAENRLDESLTPSTESRLDEPLTSKAESSLEESLTSKAESRLDESLTSKAESRLDESLTPLAENKSDKPAASPTTIKSN